jgi:hypothetical protein
MDSASAKSDHEALQARLNRRMAWALGVYGATMRMQGKEWKGVRATYTPEQLSAFVVQFKTDAFRTFVRQATGASNVRVEYYDLDVAAHSRDEIASVFRERTLAFDDDHAEYVVKLPTAWLTDAYGSIYGLLNPQLERTLVTIWQRQGCPDAPDGAGGAGQGPGGGG